MNQPPKSRNARLKRALIAVWVCSFLLGQLPDTEMLTFLKKHRSYRKKHDRQRADLIFELRALGWVVYTLVWIIRRPMGLLTRWLLVRAIRKIIKDNFGDDNDIAG